MKSIGSSIEGAKFTFGVLLAAATFVVLGLAGGTQAANASTIGGSVNPQFNYAGLFLGTSVAGDADTIVVEPPAAPVSIDGEYTDTQGNFTVPQDSGFAFSPAPIDFGFGGLEADFALADDGTGHYNEATGAMTVDLSLSLTLGVDDLEALSEELGIPLGTGSLACRLSPLEVQFSTTGGWPHPGKSFTNKTSLTDGALVGAWRYKPAIVATQGEQAVCNIIGGLLKPVGGLWLANSTTDITDMPAATSPVPSALTCAELGKTGDYPDCETITWPAAITAGPTGTTVSKSASFSFVSGDPNPHFECRVDSAPWAACTSPYALNSVAEGSHTFQVRTTYPEDSVATEPASRSWTVDTTTPPTARLGASANVVLNGQTVTFDATGSSDHADGTITGYAWDMDGDGTFEASPGSGTASRTFDQVGSFTVSVKVTNNSGKTAVASQPVEVRLAPPAGPIGVSINAGAQYTNDPNVEVTAVWPQLVTGMLFSNDGGFAAAQAFPLSGTTTWQLDSSGPERLPKTIYVRFTGGSAGAETYQDDIILDETAPLLKSGSASVQGGGSSHILGPAAATTSKRNATVVLKTKASDRTSGVAQIQAGPKKSTKLKKLAYKKTLKLKTTSRKLWVRVIDRAGNPSRWKSVKVKG